jgi:hypothetical protein
MVANVQLACLQYLTTILIMKCIVQKSLQRLITFLKDNPLNHNQVNIK